MWAAFVRFGLVVALAVLALGLALPTRKEDPVKPRAGFDLRIRPDKVIHIDEDDLVEVTLVPAR